jgi:hypothetical protein
MRNLVRAGLLAVVATGLFASIPARAQDDEAGMHHHMMHRMMRHEMHRHMMRHEMRHEMRRHMMHHMMREEMRNN